MEVLERAAGIRRLREQALEKARALIPALFLDMFGDPATNPKRWPITSLENMVEFCGGATPPKKRPEYWNGNVLWVSPKDMKFDVIQSSSLSITEKAIADGRVDFIEEKSILIVVRGLILARMVPVGIAGRKLTINQDIKALKCHKGAMTEYIYNLLRSLEPWLLLHVQTAAHGTKKLDTSVVKSIKAPLPTLDVQEAFSARVAEIRAIIAQQERSLDAVRALERSLMARLLG